MFIVVLPLCASPFERYSFMHNGQESDVIHSLDSVGPQIRKLKHSWPKLVFRHASMLQTL